MLLLQLGLGLAFAQAPIEAPPQWPRRPEAS